MSSGVELLAPAGNFDSLRAAVINGANAVYLGLDKYSARAKASNFGADEFRRAVEYAHLFGVRVYVAVNTLIKYSEFASVLDSIKMAYDAGADAFIVQDLGLLIALKNMLPDAEIHASTQMGVHNKEGAKVLEKLGVKRVILSRETTLKDISEIRDSTSLEIEFFVHGAMCISFSGNCYFSGLVSGNSGNRGQCLQFCRKVYELDCEETHRRGYLLSAKDLMLLEDLDKLIKVGVSSFKIEGRMRRPSYVGETVRVYKHALDCLRDNKTNVELKNDIARLKSMFNRGDYCKAHLFESTADVVYPYINGHVGLKIGNVEKVIGGKAVLRTAKNLRSGDGVKFVRNKTEVGSASVAESGNITGFSGNVKSGDEVFLTTDSALVNEIESRTRYLSVKASLRVKLGEPIELKLVYNDTEISVRSDNKAERAVNAPVEPSRLIDIITAQSDEIFKIELDKADIDNDIFIPISVVKSLKREALNELKGQILEDYRKNRVKTSTISDIIYKFPKFEYNSGAKRQTFVQVESIEFAELLSNYEKYIDYFVLDPAEYDIGKIRAFSDKYGTRAVLNLPNVARGEDIPILHSIVNESGINNFIANNLYALELCKGKNVLIGFMMNSINDGIDAEKIVSPERGNFDGNSVNYVFGKFPIMTFCHCEKKNLTASGCKNCNGYNAKLKDEYNNEFKLRRYRIRYCYSSLLNSLPIYLSDKARENGIEKTFVDFTGFSANEISKYADVVFCGGKADFAYTRGYYNKKLK